MVAPDARDIRTNPGPGKGHDQGAQSSQWNKILGRFPPHPSGGVSGNPIARSVRRGTLKAGRHSGRSRGSLGSLFHEGLRVDLPVQAGLRGIHASGL